MLLVGKTDVKWIFKAVGSVSGGAARWAGSDLGNVSLVLRLYITFTPGGPMTNLSVINIEPEAVGLFGETLRPPPFSHTPLL